MNIVIVGGGTAGWMTAAALAKQEHDITIFRGNEPIGVGESTTPHIDQYIKYLGLSDGDFLRAARATYKMSSRFQDFYQKDHVFHYPNGQQESREPTYHQWMQAKAFYPEKTPPFAETFMPGTTVAEEGRIPLNHPLIDPYDISKDRSFHIDGSKFVAFLQENFCSNVRVDDRKVESVMYGQGGIQHLLVERGPYDLRAPKVNADLFIDCTGQTSTLGGAQSSWMPFDTILVDTAIVRKRDYIDKDKEMVPYTNARGMSAGWQWTIPTWDYISEGYVFSSKHITEDEAKEEFGDGRVIKFRNGRYKEAWVGNCVKIVLSYGFIEPLESTSLFNTGQGILALCDILEEGLPGQFARDRFNRNMSEHLDGWREFVEAHYYYSRRRDTPFWREVTDQMEYPSEGGSAHEMINFHDVTSEPIPHAQQPIVFIYAGSENTNIVKRRSDYHKSVTTVDKNTVSMWYDMYIQRKELAQSMPTMYKYLKETVFS